jgi:hypothetical protein
MYGVLLSRFTNETYAENKRWKENNNVKCIYGSTLPISPNLPIINYFVIEMNNDINKIVGIGLIEKFVAPKVKIYSNPYFNRYIYKGNHYISIETIENKEIILELEKLLFYGKTHLKRGGITLFPKKLLKKIYLEWLIQLLKNVTNTP